MGVPMRAAASSPPACPGSFHKAWTTPVIGMVVIAYLPDSAYLPGKTLPDPFDLKPWHCPDWFLPSTFPAGM